MRNFLLVVGFIIMLCGSLSAAERNVLVNGSGEELGTASNPIKISLTGGGGGSSPWTTTSDGAYINGDATIDGNLTATSVWGTLEDVTFSPAAISNVESVVTVQNLIGYSGLQKSASGNFTSNDAHFGADLSVGNDISAANNIYVGNSLIFTNTDGVFPVNGDLSVSQDMTVDGILWAAPVSYINGMYLSYSGTTSIGITEGDGICNGNYFKNETNISHTVSNFNNDAFTYIYIDDSASSYPTPTIIDSTTEPSYDSDKLGWYNGNDRAIGAVYCDSPSTIKAFSHSENFMRYLGFIKQIASSMNPAGTTWSTPDDYESSTYLPVTATQAHIAVTGVDADSRCRIYIDNYEYTAVGGAIYQCQYRVTQEPTGNLFVQGWVHLGESRNIRISGEDNDDNSLSAYIGGYKYER